MTPGLWRRAGEAAAIVGLDWSAVPVLLPKDCDQERVLALLRLFEIGMNEALAHRPPKGEG